jgi:hypothetical protein
MYQETTIIVIIQDFVMIWPLSYAQYASAQVESCKLLHLLFGVFRILGTLMEWKRRESHDCSDTPIFE